MNPGEITAVGSGSGHRMRATIAALGSINITGRAGAVWSLPHGGDLDANLVHLDPGDTIDTHVNHDVDVLISVITGQAELVIDGTAHSLRDLVIALIPKGARRELCAGPGGITYLSIHRQPAPLGIRGKPAERHAG